MATSEIEKLERRYAENPHGLTFAPLAEVHRKNGDLARALELLTAGLELHPNYIPASIVLGRCHQDLGDLASAEAAFTHVLRLDDENVIALKSLADINERLERFGEAEGWLQRLVAVDRSNEDAREQLHRVEAARQNSTGKQEEGEEQSRNQVEEQVAEAAPPPVLEMIDLSAEPDISSGEPDPAAEQLPVALAGLEPTRQETAVPAAEVTAPEAEAPPDITPLPGLTSHSESEVREPAASLANPEVAPPAEPPPQTAAVETSAPALLEDQPEPQEVAQPLPGLISAEFQPPLQSTGGLGVETSEEVVLEPSGNPDFRVPDASEDLKSVAERLGTPPAPAETQRPALPTGEPPKAPAESDFVLSENMAEPGGVAPQPPKRSYLARDTNGQSVAAFFRALLVARPPLQSGSGGGDSAARREAATPPLSWNGSPGAGQGEEGVPVPPAVPPAGEKADGAVSFDDFFGSEPDGSSPLRQGKSDPGKDDLDQFQSWLQNLKR